MSDPSITVDIPSTFSDARRTPVAIGARDLSCWVKNKNAKHKVGCCGPLKQGEQAEKRLLDAVSFDAKPGQLTAILGPSGSGKTTLLDCLAGRIHGARMEGDVVLNGVPISRLETKLKVLAGYVKQKDLLFSTATVRETIIYAAKMRLPAEMSEEEKLDRVERLIEELGLQKCADTRLGSAADGGGGAKGGSERGVSGGELKRVALAVELITQPSLLFLDEPTSGLDAAAAFSLVSLLKRLAETDGCTIVTTIHQPRASIWSLFDQVIFMKDGQIVYGGSPDAAIDFFAHHGWRCPTYTNPADYLLDVIAEQRDEKNSTTSVQKLAKRYRKRSKKEFGGSLMQAEEESARIQISSSAAMIDQQSPGALTQFAVLFVRAWRNNIRHQMILAAQAAQYVFLAVFAGLMYLRLGEKALTNNLAENPTIVADRLAAMFFALLNVSIVAGFTDVVTFPPERAIFNRERASGHYGVLPYYLALTFSNMPIQIVLVTVNATVAYWMIGLRADGVAYLIFVGMCMITTLTLQAICLIVSALCPSVEMANMVASMFLLMSAAFGGFFLSAGNIPPWFKPFEYLSPLKYGFHALVQNDLNGLQFNCTQPAAATNVTMVPTSSPPFCPYPDGATALQFFGMHQGSIGIDVAVLVGMFVFYRIAVYLVLLFVKVGED